MNSKPDQSGNLAYKQLAEKINALEQRITLLESDKKHYLASVDQNEIENDEIGLSFKVPGRGVNESSIGEFGLAWLGNIVLFEFIIKGTAADPKFGGGFFFVPFAFTQNFPEQTFFIFH